MKTVAEYRKTGELPENTGPYCNLWTLDSDGEFNYEANTKTEGLLTATADNDEITITVGLTGTRTINVNNVYIG